MGAFAVVVTFHRHARRTQSTNRVLNPHTGDDLTDPREQMPEPAE